MSLLDESIKKKYDDGMIEFLDDLGYSMVSYYGDEYLRNIKETLNTVQIVKGYTACDGFRIDYSGNTISKYNPEMNIRINGNNGSRLFLIREIVKALMSFEGVDKYCLNNYNKVLIDENEEDKHHNIFEEAATEYDALMIYNLMFPAEVVDNSVLSLNAKRAAILLDNPIARSIVNQKRFEKDFLLFSVPESSYCGEEEMKALRMFVMGFINNFPDNLEEYNNDINNLVSGEVENCKTNKYEHLNRLRKAFAKR